MPNRPSYSQLNMPADGDDRIISGQRSISKAFHKSKSWPYNESGGHHDPSDKKGIELLANKLDYHEYTRVIIKTWNI